MRQPQAIAKAEAVRGHAARLIGTPALCLSANGTAAELAPGRTPTVGHGVAILTDECARHA